MMRMTRAVHRRLRWGAAILLTTVVLGLAYACGVVLQATVAPSVRPTPATWAANDLSIAYVGHASVLVDFGGTRILTDPAFFARIGVGLGPITLGPRRVVEAALAPEDLPPLDAVVVSHAHLDSLDRPSLARLSATPLLVVPARTTDVVADLGFPNVVEVGWGETVDAGAVTIEAVEIDHWGKRWPWERWRGYNGYLFSRGADRVLFASDTAYTPTLGIYARARGVQVVVLGIGAYDPWIMNHADPEQAWQMFRESGAQTLLPVHWDTFRLGREPLGDAIRRLLVAAGSDADRVGFRRIGDTWARRLPLTPSTP
jgi:L-ascorbate metabolism protein UlaG (beta-lactamase superfamily)